MKADSVSLGPEMVAELGECEVGETKQILLTVTVDSKDESGLTATVSGVEPYEAAEEDYEEPPGSKAMRMATGEI